MMRLERLHADIGIAERCPYALCACLCSSHSGDIGNAVLDSGLSDVAVVMCAGLACGSIDDELDITVCDGIGDIGSALMQLVYALAGDACRTDKVT